jgi:hypothetical protein
MDVKKFPGLSREQVEAVEECAGKLMSDGAGEAEATLAALTAVLNKGADGKRNAEKQAEKQPENKKLFFWEPKTIAQIMSTDYPPIRWVADGVIPEGLTMITGGPKCGKSWTALNLAAAVSSGGIFMGCVAVEQRKVLYLALEDNERRIKDRYATQGGEVSDNLLICTPASWRGGVAALRAFLKESPVGLVIIDTLFKFNPIDDTNAYSETYKPIAALQEISAGLNIPVILIHHTRKGSHNNAGEGWAEESMGSQGIVGAVDTTIFLQKKEGGNGGLLRVRGRDIEEKCYSVTFDRDVCSWIISGEADLIQRGDPAAQAEVLELLKKAGEKGMRTKDVADALGKKNNTVGNIFKILAEKGKIEKITHGVFRYSDKFTSECP